MTSNITKLNILVIDDDPEDALLLKRQLQKQDAINYSLYEASNLSQAEEILYKIDIDIIISDYRLGKETGMDMFPILDKMELDIPVILLTGGDLTALEETVLNSEAVELVGKSELSPYLLQRTIRFVLRNHKLVKELKHLAHYDILTKLVNRGLFMDRLDSALRHARRYNSTLALLFLDLDHFKQVNDHYGHDAGDKVLVTVSNRLLSILREVDTVGRLGGDEFVILLNSVSTTTLHQVARRIIDTVSESIQDNKNTYQIGTSIGIRICHNDDFPEANRVISEADSALYEAKAGGRGEYVIYGETKQDTRSATG